MEYRKIDFYREKREKILAFLGTLLLDMPRNKKYSIARARFDSSHPAQETVDSDNPQQAQEAGDSDNDDGTVATAPCSELDGESDQEQDVQKGLSLKLMFQGMDLGIKDKNRVNNKKKRKRKKNAKKAEFRRDIRKEAIYKAAEMIKQKMNDNGLPLDRQLSAGMELWRTTTEGE
jgi:cysteinyl-tRNA synthetase